MLFRSYNDIRRILTKIRQTMIESEVLSEDQVDELFCELTTYAINVHRSREMAEYLMRVPHYGPSQ